MNHPSEDKKTNIILAALGVIPVVWAALMVAPFLSDGLAGIIEGFTSGGWVRKLMRGFLRRLFGLLGKIRVLLAPADQLGGACGFVDLDKPVPAHFLRNFIAGFQLFAQFVSPPIRALARVQ